MNLHCTFREQTPPCWFAIGKVARNPSIDTNSTDLGRSYHHDVTISDRKVVGPDLSEGAVQVATLFVKAIVLSLPHRVFWQSAATQG